MNNIELIKLLKEEKSKNETILKNRKNNISPMYDLAMIDLVAIKNFQDEDETLRVVIEELEELQKRIVERNRKGINI